ncbi:hypothetical protein NDU88_002180 [Pleurodeles waltl]|uniref:Uncharacterized protein n=1 Tax=Pleurodeles waltl TaxID=8319 RepID=A0AAV7WPJ9_PLEWA|nr:hypothetical protein NDU88_002180 [Pleurodeles waltl]
MVECGTGWTDAGDRRLAVGVKDALWVAPVCFPIKLVFLPKSALSALLEYNIILATRVRSHFGTYEKPLSHPHFKAEAVVFTGVYPASVVRVIQFLQGDKSLIFNRKIGGCGTPSNRQILDTYSSVERVRKKTRARRYPSKHCT